MIDTKMQFNRASLNCNIAKRITHLNKKTENCFSISPYKYRGSNILLESSSHHHP
jgi:hypothetical protein